MDCKCILLRERPSCRFMHSLGRNENIPMWGKHRCRITREIAIPPYPDHYLILKRGQRWRASWTRTTLEQLKRSHSQCEHSYWKGNNIIWMQSVALVTGGTRQPRHAAHFISNSFFFSVFQSVLGITSRKSMYGTIMSGNTQAGSWNELPSRTSAMGWNGMPTVTLIQLVRLQIALSTTSLQIVLSTRVVNTATKLSFEVSTLLNTDSRARTTF